MHSEGMIHGDLKGVWIQALIITSPPKTLFIKLNILIDQDGHACLADFGLLTIILDSTYHTSSTTPNNAGTTRWMSPELLDPDRFGLGDGRPTKHSDCYALGMVILEVLTGEPPFPNCSGFVVMRKVIEGECPGRPQGEDRVWFTDNLWEMLRQCWSPQPERRPTINAILQCLEQGSMAWKPLPPDSDGHIQSESDNQLHFPLSHDSSINPSMFLHLVLNPTYPPTAVVVAQIDPQDDGGTPVPSQNQSHSVYVGQGLHQLSPGSQQRLAKLPVSVMFNITDTFDNHVKIITSKSPVHHHVGNMIPVMLNLILQHAIHQFKYILPGAVITYYYGTVLEFFQTPLSYLDGNSVQSSWLAK